MKPIQHSALQLNLQMCVDCVSLNQTILTLACSPTMLQARLRQIGCSYVLQFWHQSCAMARASLSSTWALLLDLHLVLAAGALGPSHQSVGEQALVAAVLGTGAAQERLVPALMGAYAAADHVVG